MKEKKEGPPLLLGEKQAASERATRKTREEKKLSKMDPFFRSGEKGKEPLPRPLFLQDR